MSAFFFLFLFLAASASRAEDPWIVKATDGETKVRLHFFWSRACPHCVAAHPFVAAIPRQRPWVVLHEYELSQSRANLARFATLARAAGGEAAAVPSFIFCGEMLTGWDGADGMGKQLEQALEACHARLQAGLPATAPLQGTAGSRVALPFFGAIEVDDLSLPILTLVLAGLDAFNPCAFFVLLFLLSLLTHQKSRQRMLTIGGVFVAISGLLYFAFMAAWLNVFALFGHLGGVTVAAGLLAALIGLANVKDFFWFGKGVTLSIPESKKPALFRRARAILMAENLPGMLAATVVLAVAANFYELLCTAGLPMVYTRLLTLAEPSVAGRYAWLAIYNLIYVLPLAAIVIVFAHTLGARKLSEREGRLLKLLSGMMMLELGVLLLVAPTLVGRSEVAFGLLAVAVGLTVLAAKMSHAGRA